MRQYLPTLETPYSHACRVKHSKLQRSRSLTDMHTLNVLALSPVRYCAAYDETCVLIPARVGPVRDLSVPEMIMTNMAL
jgi:hypothetical protein